MARNESDREDLLGEATALGERIEWRVPGEPEPVVAGLRRQGGLSLYFGSDPVYQFDATGALRRAYVDGFLYRTQGTTLARLHRERSAAQTTLVRHDLGPEELGCLLEAMRLRLHRLLEHLRSGRCRVLRHVSDGRSAGIETALATAARSAPQLAPALLTRRN